MFDSSQKSTGTAYTTTVAFLIVALIFVPAALMFFDNFGNVAIVLAVFASLACLGMAWRSWKKSSQLSIPSIENQQAPSK
jgi:heme O synthase-like polyprenyltransferase